MLQYNVFRLHAMYKTDSLILQVGQVGNGEGWTPIQEGLDGEGWGGMGRGGGGANVSCQLKSRPFVSCQLNFGTFVSCQLSGC